MHVENAKCIQRESEEEEEDDVRYCTNKQERPSIDKIIGFGWQVRRSILSRFSYALICAHSIRQFMPFTTIQNRVFHTTIEGDRMKYARKQFLASNQPARLANNIALWKRKFPNVDAITSNEHHAKKESCTKNRMKINRRIYYSIDRIFVFPLQQYRTLFSVGKYSVQ